MCLLEFNTQKRVTTSRHNGFPRLRKSTPWQLLAWPSQRSLASPDYRGFEKTRWACPERACQPDRVTNLIISFVVLFVPDRCLIFRVLNLILLCLIGFGLRASARPVTAGPTWKEGGFGGLCLCLKQTGFSILIFCSSDLFIRGFSPNVAI